MKSSEWRFRKLYYCWRWPINRLVLSASWTWGTGFYVALHLRFWHIKVAFWAVELQAEFRHKRNCECDQCLPF